LGGLPAIGVMPDTAIKSTQAVELAANAVSAAETLDTVLVVDPSINAASATEAIEPIQAVEEQAVEDAPSIPAMESSVKAAHCSDEAVEFGLLGAESIVSILVVGLSSEVKHLQTPLSAFWLWRQVPKLKTLEATFSPESKMKVQYHQATHITMMPQSTIRSLPANMIYLGE
jgi:hypothetical protein